jgi:hypothetical protein
MAIYRLGGTTSGTTNLGQPSLHLHMVFSGRLYGSTLLSDTFLENFSDSLNGSTSFSNPILHLRKHFGEVTTGETRLGVCLPYAVVGCTALAANLRVVTIQPLSCVCGTSKSFRWAHLFTKNDLTLSLRNGFAPITVYEVWYTLFQVRPGGTRILIGPQKRMPVVQGVGEYYVSGYVGREGQPGSWQLTWSYRKSFNGPVRTETVDFTVVDSVSSPIPGDPTCRVKKYGWTE